MSSSAPRGALQGAPRCSGWPSRPAAAKAGRAVTRLALRPGHKRLILGGPGFTVKVSPVSAGVSGAGGRWVGRGSSRPTGKRLLAGGLGRALHLDGVGLLVQGALDGHLLADQALDLVEAVQVVRLLLGLDPELGL